MLLEYIFLLPLSNIRNLFYSLYFSANFSSSIILISYLIKSLLSIIFLFDTEKSNFNHNISKINCWKFCVSQKSNLSCRDLKLQKCFSGIVFSDISWTFHHIYKIGSCEKPCQFLESMQICRINNFRDRMHPFWAIKG